MSLWVAALVLAVLAACRLTHLVTADTITRPLRLHLAEKARPDNAGGGIVRWNLIWDLVRCPWCIGFWISLGCVAVAWLVAPHPALPGWFAVPAEALGCSYVVAWLAGWEDDD